MPINKKALDLLASKIARKVFSEGTYIGHGDFFLVNEPLSQPSYIPPISTDNNILNILPKNAIKSEMPSEHKPLHYDMYGGTCVKEPDDCRNGLLSIFQIDDSQGYTTFDASAKDVIKKSEYTYEELPIKRGDKS